MELAFCVPEIFEFQKKFVEPISGILLLKTWRSSLPIVYFGTCLKEGDCVIKI